MLYLGVDFPVTMLYNVYNSQESVILRFPGFKQEAVISMNILLTICALSLITMLKQWHSRPIATITQPSTTPVGRFGYEDNSARNAASLFKDSTADV